MEMHTGHRPEAGIPHIQPPTSSRSTGGRAIAAAAPAETTELSGLSVIIPTLNERESLTILLPRLQEALSAREFRWEIIVVDSESSDGTPELVRDLNRNDSRMVLLEGPPPGDVAAAWRCGYEQARFDLLATMDADGVHSPEDLLRLYDRAIQGPDLVIGSRYTGPGRKRDRHKALGPELASRWGQTVARVLLRLPAADSSHGFRIVRRAAWRRIAPRCHSAGNALMIEMCLQAARQGLLIAEVPIRYGRREHGEDKLNLPRELRRFCSMIQQARRSGQE